MAQIERSTFIDSITATEEQMRELRRRIEHLAERLCGEVPDESEHTEAPNIAGLFGETESASIRMRDQIREANEALSRIESRLPYAPKEKPTYDSLAALAGAPKTRDW